MFLIPVCREDKEVFSSRIAHGETTNGRRAAVDHDIAAEFGPTIAAAFVFVEFIGIIDAKGEMKPAVGVQGFDLVKAFRDLAISFLQFWTGCPARGENWIRFEKLKSMRAVGHPELKLPLLFEADEYQLLWRISYADFTKARFEASMDNITEFLDTVGYGSFTSHGRGGVCGRSSELRANGDSTQRERRQKNENVGSPNC
jgi:hypothetical protein